jgi:hypothetical protein
MAAPSSVGFEEGKGLPRARKRRRADDYSNDDASPSSPLPSPSGSHGRGGGVDFRAKEDISDALERFLPDHGQGAAGSYYYRIKSQIRVPTLSVADMDDVGAGGGAVADKRGRRGGTGGAEPFLWAGDDQRTLATTRSKHHQQQPWRGQSVQDFMDEQDHEDWGGPAGIRAEFLAGSGGAKGTAASATRTTTSTARTSTAATDLFEIRFRPGVGERLLRVLGWREGTTGSSAYVPEGRSKYGDSEAREPDRLTALSSLRLRKVELDKVESLIPPPKLDLYGLGYEPFRNAPEFASSGPQQRARECKSRHSAATGVYRVSTALGLERALDGEESDDPVQSLYASRESQHEWIGRRTVGGFSLHDDDDGAYDDEHDDGVFSDRRMTATGTNLCVNREAFDTELDVGDGDHSSIDEQEGTTHDVEEQARKQRHAAGGASQPDVGGLFSSWADSASAPSNIRGGKPVVATSDGRPVLPGFVLSAVDGTLTARRFRGPDVPVDYDVTPHVFGPRENPLVFQALLHAETLQSNDDQRSVRGDSRPWIAARLAEIALQHEARLASTPPPPRGPTSARRAAFAGISQAMNARFTAASSTSVPLDPEHPLEMNATATTGQPAQPRTVEVIRTYAEFAPASLLCKRFQVPVPALLSTAPASFSHRTKEEAFFQDEILSRLTPTKSEKGEDLSATHSDSSPKQDGLVEILNSQAPVRPPDEYLPSVEVFKSIFEPRDGEADDSTGATTPVASANASLGSGRSSLFAATAPGGVGAIHDKPSHTFLSHAPKALSKPQRPGDDAVEETKSNGLQAKTDEGQIEQRRWHSSRKERSSRSRSDSENTESEDSSSSPSRQKRKRDSKRKKRRDERRDKRKHKRKSRRRSD